MKKIAKLSFVAAVAVAGLTSANAAALEEAIKNVDISGTATYRYDDRDQYAGDKNTNSYKVAVNLKSKVTDDITFASRTIIGNDNSVTGGSNSSDMVGLDTSDADQNAGFALSRANFIYTGLANTTIIAGKQAVPSPFAVQADAAGDEDNGTGITAVSNFGAVTLAATYLNQTNLVTEGADIAGLGVMANVGPVALDGWYLDVAETSATNDGHKAYTIGGKTKIAMLTTYARYSAVDHDATDSKDTLWKIGAAGKFGPAALSVDYGQTGKQTPVTGVGLTGDADADVNLQGWATNLQAKDDASLVKVTGKVDVMPAVNLALTYADLSVDGTDNADVSEVYGQVTFKPAKNFMTYVRFGQVDADANDDKGYRGRLHVQYSF